MDDDYDTPWKEVVSYYFSDFMAFFFRDAHAAIDWTRRFDFLDQELAALSPGARMGKRRLDKLVQVRLRGSRAEQWVMIHLEIQSQRDTGFAERVFTYHYRVYDRYRRPVASLAVLADDGTNWRPSSFSYDLMGSQMALFFPIVKLHDYASRIEELLAHQNLFALVTATHLLSQRSKRNAHKRRQAKWRLIKLVYTRAWDEQRIIDALRVIDWMMRLPEARDVRLRLAAYLLEEKIAMTYITSFERAGMRKGRQEGLLEGRQEGRLEGRAEMLAEFLAARFGGVADALRIRMTTAPAEQLSAWARRAAHATTLDEVFRD
ncbi:transposase [Duganella sp. FT80W]|uniref:Transposase n=1 Tax=Duganella guangzhouensis TaxID=2666084 RepID=A0A6I2L328_9BURK|nr:transposase [Duganella guangzhouensis]MRW92120.1 transposase [Duganella guangzhouensis]